MRLALSLLTVVAAIFVFASSADGAMILTTTFRSVGSSPSPPVQNTTTGAFDANSPFGHVIAEQHSNITTTALSGELSSFRDHTFSSSGHSNFFVDFTLTAAHTFNLTAATTSGGTFFGYFDLVAVTGSISPQAVSNLTTGINGSLNETGVLGPGTYTLSATAFNDGFQPGPGYATSVFEFTVSPLAVPEPGTLALACVGIGTALIARRTKRRRDRQA